MASGERAIELLESIDKSLKQLLSRQSQAAAASSGSAGQVASDRDLDGPYGDPVIKAKDPRDWIGPTMKGRKFSECPPEYLDLIADRLDWFAEQHDAEGKKTDKGVLVSKYDRADAARARGWAKRILDGQYVQTQPVGATANGWAGGQHIDDDIPF